MTVLLADDWHIARKAHQCDVCFGTIAEGDRYRRQRMIYDGDPGVFKAHALCDAVYWVAWRELELFDDEQPDFHDDIKPRLLRFFALVSGGDSIDSDDDGSRPTTGR